MKTKRFPDYGVGDAVVVVVSVVVDVEVSGVDVAIGVLSAGLVVVVVVVVSDVAGEGEAAGAVVSVRCSQAAKSAAPARMQMYFFIMLRIGWGILGQRLNRGKGSFRSCFKDILRKQNSMQLASAHFKTGARTFRPCASATTL